MGKANYDLPDQMILEVKNLSGSKTKREAIIIALESYLRQSKLAQLMKSYGKFSLAWTKRGLKRFRK